MRWIPERVVKKFNLAIPTYDAVKTWTTVPPPELPSVSASEPVQAVMQDEPSSGEDVVEAAAAAQAQVEADAAAAQVSSLPIAVQQLDTGVSFPH